MSRYPAISHTFILREKLALAAHGIHVEVASVNAVDRPASLLTADEQSEARATFYLKLRGAGSALNDQVAFAARYPIRFFRALVYALRLADSDLRKVVYSLFYLAEAVILARWMNRRQLTHLHVHFATPAATVGIILTKLGPFSLSVTIHGPDEFYDVPGYFLSEKVAVSKFICAISQYARSQMMKISPVAQWKKIHVTPLGVDPAHFSPREPIEQNGEFELLCVGRLVPAKGHHLLLKAAGSLQKAGCKVRVRLVGDGPDRQSLGRLAEELALPVAFEGAVNQDRIGLFYKQADAFVLASFAEGVPVVLMEAMAMEIPCISTWVAGIPELIRNGTDGLLVPAGDQEALARAIRKLIDEPQLRASIGVAGRKRVLEQYNLSVNVSRLATVFQTQLGGQS